MGTVAVPEHKSGEIIVPKVNRKSSRRAAVTPIQDPLQSQIDRLGLLRALLAENAAKIADITAEEKTLSAKLQARYEQNPPDEVISVEGKEYVLKVGARANEQAIVPGGMNKVFEIVGADRFIAKAKITFENLKGMLDGEYSNIVISERTGRRNLTVVRKIEPLKAA